MKNIIVGTAGHIDHGKTTLIKYLTGIDTDRLPEEKEKQMTIDIGFSHIKEKDMNIGIVDVPGHQKFIKNMLSGISGINYVLFLIASDDGIMPQTIEHFEILKLLDIKSGMIILTKTDLVDLQKISSLKKEIREKFKNSFLENFEIYETSIKDLKTFENLKIKLLKNISQIEIQDKKDNFLMYIDRAFTVKGVGSIVTGSVAKGFACIGDNIFIYPQKKKLKIKSIEMFGEKVENIYKNSRGAFNLGGIEYKEIKRGNFLYSEDNLLPVERIDVFFTGLDGKKIKNNQKIRIYLGTDEIIGKILFFEEYKSGYIGQIIFEKEVFAFEGQLGIIRNFAPLDTLGGIKILNLKSQKISKKSNSYDEYLKNLKDIFDEKDLKEEKKNKEKENIVQYLENFHTKNPLEKGIKSQIIKKDLNIDLKEFENNKIIKIVDGYVSLNEFKIKLSKEEKNLKEKIFKIYKNSGFYMVKYEIIERSFEKDYSKDKISKIHKYMVENQMIIYLDEDRYILSGFFKEAQKKLKEYFLDSENKKNGITLGKFREIIASNRESAVSIINKLEKTKFLINRKNIRFLREEK